MHPRWLVVVVIASLALNAAVVSTYLFERFRLRRPGPPLPGMKPAVVRELRELRREFRPRMDALRGQALQAREGLMHLAMQPEPDPARVESLLLEVSRSETALNRLAFEHARRISARLPEAGRAAFSRRLRHHHLRPGRMMMHRGMRRRQPPRGEDCEEEDVNR